MVIKNNNGNYTYVAKNGTSFSASLVYENKNTGFKLFDVQDYIPENDKSGTEMYDHRLVGVWGDWYSLPFDFPYAADDWNAICGAVSSFFSKGGVTK